MRHIRLFAIAAPLTLTLIGCGPESPSGDGKPLNPAASVYKTFDSFRIQNESGVPEIVKNTLYWDFYRGLEPAEGEDDQNTAAAIRGRLNELMGLTPSADGTFYVDARNPIDFLNYVIDSNLVTTFNDGRRLMRDSIAKGEPARYNTQANNATVRFIEDDPAGSEPETDQIWVYPLIDWTSNPLNNKVLSARQFIARTPKEESEAPPEIRSAIWSARFNERTFSVSGHNTPEYELYSQTAETLGNTELRKEYIDVKTDTFFLINPPPETTEERQCQDAPPENPLGITIAGENPDCVRIEIDYANSEVRVFTSLGQASQIEDGDSCKLNFDFCGLQSSAQNDEAVVYNSVLIDGRQ